MNPTYRTREFFIANINLLAHISAVILYIFDKQHFGIIVTNPLLFFIFGFIVWKTATIYTPYNSLSYIFIKGEIARDMGLFLITMSVVSFIGFNFLNLYYPNYPNLQVYVLSAQLVTSLVVQVMASLRYGTIV